MRYYPIFLDIRNRNCLVVGGGEVGTRKVNTLMACGAKVTVISPVISPQLTTLCDQGQIVAKSRTYRHTDLDGMFLVISATDDDALNRSISREAEHRQMLCNIADQPDKCNFILPSIINRDDLTIAISTAGQSPAFAKHLRQQLSTQFGPEYGRFLALMGAIRQHLLSREHAPEAHKPLFEALIKEGLLDLIRENRTDAIDVLLVRVLGEGFDAATLLSGMEDDGETARQ